MKYIFFSWFIFIIVSCQNREKKDNMIKGIESIGDNKKYDSVIYYQNAIWTSFRGINKLDKNNLSYPYAAFLYKGDSLFKVYIVYNQNKIKFKYFKNYNGLLYIQSSYYNPELKDTLYQYKFLKPDGSLITFDSDSKTIQDSMKIHTIYHEMDASLVNHSNQYFTLAKESCSFHDLLLFDTTKLRSHFREYGEEKLLIDKNKLYQIHDFHEQLSFNRISENNKKTLIVEKLNYSSFFYYYNDENLYNSLP